VTSSPVRRPDRRELRGALGGRDLSLALTPDGVEETVVLADRAAPATYVGKFRLPAGVSARATDK